MRDDEGGDAGGIGLEGEYHHVAHQRNVLIEIRRDARWGVHLRICHRHAFGLFDAPLDLSHARQVLVELLTIASIQLLLYCLRVLQNKIQNGMLFGLPAFEVLNALAGQTDAEEPLEYQPRIRLGRERLCG